MNGIELITGKVIEANRGIVGIDDAGNIFEGYDGTIENYENGVSVTEDGLTIGERISLANVMLARWTTYRARWENAVVK